jgi:chromosome segregation protein
VELKSLELFGFKSFADRTRFDFDSGITVIVGPNGCGKSNVVDAVKWVLGEQSPKSLRGREMADIIFAGSESRRSLGFAEATLLFDNTRGLLPIGVTEVEVSRRLYRSGESEYMLNRKPCRLRDVRELFMDTGVGVDAYSLIEQGKVDVLLQSNPQERRIIFEEAAGISKYKAKRREAERKLQRTEQNLLRLNDILEEVERRLRSVKYQAGKARNYVEYTGRLKELRVSYALSQYHQESQALAAHQAAIEGLEAQRSARAAALAALDQEKARAEGERMDLENRARDIDSRLSDVRSGVATRENEIGFHRTRAGELGQVVERDRRKIADLSAHLREAEASVEARRAAQAGMADQARKQEETVSAIEAELAQVNEDVRAAAGRVEAAKAALMDLAQARSERASRLTAIELRLESVEAQTAKLRARLEEIGASLMRLAQEETGLEAETVALDAAIAEHRSRLEEKRHEAEAKQKEVEDAGERLARARQEAAVLDSRRGLLEDLERRGEGIPAAVRQTREAIAAAGAPERWHGMVADLIEVDLAHAVIIDSALGPAEKLLVADRQADVLDLARRLEGQLPGQVRFLALDAVRPAGDGKDLSAHPEAVGWAMDYVRAADAVRPAIAHLLSRTVVVRSLEGAVALAAGPLAGYRFVTLSGNVLEPDGTVAIGPPGPETSLISRRSELRDLAREREALGLRIEQLDAHRREAVEQLRALDVDQQALRQEIYEGSMAKVEAEGRQRRLADLRRGLESEAPVVESELAALAAQRDQAAAGRDALRREVEDLAAREAAEMASISAQAAEQEALTARRAACEESRTQGRIALAQVREKQAALADQQTAAERDLAATRDGIAQSQADLAECRDRILQSERAMLRLQSELSMLFHEKETAEGEARRLAAARQACRDAIEALAEKGRELEAESDGLRQQIHERELERRGIETKQAELVQRVRDDFGMDLPQRYAQWQPEEVDWDAVAEEIKNLQGKIERLGAVNLEAIQEQEALENRVGFLRGQRDDLTKAREALGGLIDRINRESRERFMKTFEAVRGHFQELYRKLFGGGKADVFLENEADVLESGVEVVARPPGKQLQRISLLSGGEKTMTAVALLLAIFRARPSPFCILDEVDAAMDESNVDRFTSLVREFLDQSQFVVITHNKRTMSVADVLYGVTMGEPGVSRKVSVKFSDVHEKGYVATDEKEPRRAREAAPPAAVAPEIAAALAHGRVSEPPAERAAEPAAGLSAVAEATDRG